jgi:hypothetical protein
LVADRDGSETTTPTAAAAVPANSIQVVPSQVLSALGLTEVSVQKDPIAGFVGAVFETALPKLADKAVSTYNLVAT